MSQQISQLSEIHPDAKIGQGVRIGPFCLVGPDVELGDGCVLDSHVSLIGHTTIGTGNRFHAGAVIGDEPQDHAYNGAPTRVVIGNNNVFREGVTVHRGAEKEDHTTRIGNNNAFFANSHVAHNCVIHDNVILVNGVLLGGHVHVHDRAIISGNTVVHHFSSVGTIAFVSGGGRVVQDIPPYMMAAGNDSMRVRGVNTVGMQRAGIDGETIALIRKACRLLHKRRMSPAEVRAEVADQAGHGSQELETLLTAIEFQKSGKNGRGREGLRDAPSSQRNAA